MLLRPVILFAAFFFPLAAADLTGHWTFEGDVNGSPIQLDCHLKQDGTKLEGTCKSAAAEVRLAGEVNDPKVRFSYAVEYQGSTYTLYYSGTLASDSAMKGEIEVSGTAGTFSAKKANNRSVSGRLQRFWPDQIEQ
jgi:hypothetical protein